MQLDFSQQLSPYSKDSSLTSGVGAFFKSISPKHRMKLKAHYDWLIENEEDRLNVTINRKTGKQMKYDKLPWMKDFWLKGQKIITDVMIELGEIKSNNQ